MRLIKPGIPKDLDTHPWEGATIEHDVIGCGAELQIEESDVRVSKTINGNPQRGKALIVTCEWCHKEFSVYDQLPGWLANRILAGTRKVSR